MLGTTIVTIMATITTRITIDIILRFFGLLKLIILSPLFKKGKTMFLFIIVVILSLFGLYKIHQSSKMDQQKRDQFWEEEREADNVRRQDISSLDYLTIPYDLLPFDESAKEPVKTYQSTLYKLQSQKILNLTGYTNTELKKLYGPANLPDLMEYDANYTLLCRTIAQWGKFCYDSDDFENARTLFEYGIQIHTDVSYNYILLAKIYQMQNEPDKIKDLIQIAQTLRSLMKESILKQLNELSGETPDTPLK